jgi:hypothetical protein
MRVESVHRVQRDLPFREPNCVFPASSLSTVRQFLSQLLINPNFSLTVEGLYAKIEECFLSGACSQARHSKRQSGVRGWWQYVPEELRTEIKVLEADSAHMFNQWSQGAGAYSVADVVNLRRRYNAAYREASQVAEQAIMQRMHDRFPNPGLCWKVLKSIRNPDPTVAIDVSTLIEHFRGVFHRRDRPLVLNQPAVTPRMESDSYDEAFTDEELVIALRELNAQAVTGPELIPSAVLRDVFLAEESARVSLLALMNLCFHTGTVPSSWGESELFILYKGKGLRTVADNYRAIALSNDVRRIYERLLIVWLNRWSTTRNATGSMQFGFKKGTGTLEAIFVLRSMLLHTTRVKRLPAGYVCFVDLRKAFPSTCRGKLVEVFARLGVPGKITNAFAALMSMNTNRLRVNGRVTDPFFVTSGTPEGFILSPEAFSLLFKVVVDALGIEELPDDLSLIDPSRVYFIAFADDLSLFSLNLKALEACVQRLKVVCAEYDLCVSDAKTKWMFFPPPVNAGSDVEPSDLRLRVGDVEVELVDEFHYLGFRLDSQLTDVIHVKLINGRYPRAARVVGKLIRDLRCTNPFSLRKFYLTLVSLQLYGVLFVNTELIEFERGVGVFYRTALGLPESFPTVVAMAVLAVKLPSVFILEQRTKFLLKAEVNDSSPVFTALVADWCELFPRGVGLNAWYGLDLEKIGVLRTLDY